MTLQEKAGQMAQIELSVASPRALAELGVGSLLNGGGRPPFDGASPSDWAGIVDSMQRLALSSRLSVPIIYGVDAVHGHNNMLGVILFCVVSPTSGEGGVRASIAQGRERIAAAASAFRGDILSARSLASGSVAHREKLDSLKDQLRVLQAALAEALSSKVHGGRLNFRVFHWIASLLPATLFGIGTVSSSPSSALCLLSPVALMILVAFEPRLWCGSMAVVPWLSGLAARVLS
ncbi:Lysosomal beta glucosidase [Hordeum vulgare]|nr:Lysosomal beta glucosidase [Hordeum vulgare]